MINETINQTLLNQSVVNNTIVNASIEMTASEGQTWFWVLIYLLHYNVFAIIYLSICLIIFACIFLLVVNFIYTYYII